MSEEMRKTGIDVIGDVTWGTHFCQFYKTKKDLVDILVPYFKAGLENNEFCIWITSKPLTESNARKALSKVLPDLASYLKKGQIEIIPYDRWYLRNGVFNSKRVLKGWLSKLNKALAKGYDGLRLTGNTFWLEKKDWRSFANYERQVDDVIGQYRMIALCTYSLDKCKANEVIDVVQNHQFALIKREGKWERIESSGRKKAKGEIERFASFPQLNPNPVLELDLSGKITFCNDAAIRSLRESNLKDKNVFLPQDIENILKGLGQNNEAQFYREVKIKDRIFAEILYFAPQFNSLRIYANDITERKSYHEALQNALQESRQREAEISALLEASSAVLKYPDFDTAAGSIFDSCKKLIGATSGYIALLSKDGTENEVLFLDSGGLPCTVDPDIPMPIRGLREEAYRNAKTVYDNDFSKSKWKEFLPKGHVRLRNVLFAPLIVDGKAVGLLGIANKTGGFTENDARLASAFADLAAIALTQKRAEEALRHSEEYYRIVTENSSDITTILDANGTIQYESQSIEQVLGYKQEELIGKSAFELIHPDDLPNVMDTFSQGLQKPGVTLSVEFRFRHKDGSWRILSIAGKNLLDNPVIKGIVVNSRDITERKRSEELLKESEGKYRSLFSNMTNGFAYHKVLLDDSGKPYDYVFLEINDAFERLTGLKREDVIGKRVTEVIPGIENDPADWIGTYGRIALPGESTNFENYSSALKKWYSVSAYCPSEGYFAVTFDDITDRKKKEEELHKLNRTLRALSNSNQALMRTKTESGYLEEVCSIIVKDCGYAMVWIGFAEEDDGKIVLPVASAGFEEGYLETLNITWADTERGRGPTGTAIRTAKPSICRNMLTDPAFKPWRKEAIKRGYASSIVLPLMANSKAFGALNIYSREPDPFTEDEVKLLSELASDLSYGISAIRLRVEHAQAEETIRQSEERYRSLVEMSPDALFVNRNNKIAFVNPAALELFGAATAEQLLGKSPFDVFHPGCHAVIGERIRKLLDGNPVPLLEEKIIRVDGTVRDVEVAAAPFDDQQGRAIQVVLRDVTERKRMEEELRKSRDELEMRVQERTAELKKTVDTLHDEIEERIIAQKVIKEQSDILDSLFKDTLTPLVLLDPDFNFIRVNEAYSRVCRKDVTEFEGHNYFEFYPHEENEAIFREVVEAKFPYQAIAKPFVFPDHPEWGVTYWDWTLTPLFDEYGEVKFLVLSSNDVTERKRAEEAVKAERQRLYSVLEKLPAYVCLLTPAYTFAYVNQEFKKIFGDPGDRQCHEFFFNIQEPCGGCQTYKIFSEHKNHQEWEWVGPNGNTYAIYDYAFTDVDGSPLILEMGLDITERKIALDHLSVTSKLLEFFVTKSGRKEYLDAAIDLLHEWTDCECVGVRILDKQGNIPYESYTGFSTEFWEAENWISVKNHQCACIRVVLQKPDLQDMNMMTPNGSFYCNNTEEFAGLLTEEQLSRYRGLCIRTGFKSVAIVPIRYKESIVGAIHIADKREGMVPLAKIEFIESLTPLMGEAIFRFSAEEELAQSEERYRMLVETMNEGLGMDDKNGLLVYANDRLCEMLGYSQDEIIGRPVLSFFDEKNQNILREQIEKRKRGESESYRLEWIKKDGQKIITIISPRGIFDTKGEYKGSFAVITDITEKLKLESIAEAVNTMKNIGFIFSGIRHEIGNPVNSIKMALSVLKQNMDSYSKEMVEEYADRMLSEIVRMEYLLKAMKNFNMYETLELMDIDITSFMEKFLSLVVSDFDKKGIKIDAAITDTLWAYGDPRALQQVLLNIMTNAADALEGREYPRIAISVSRLGDMVNIRVEDNGIGMSEEQQEDLFKPFYTTKAKGTGLGLVITKKMMTKMKGFIDVVSEKNKGTIVDLFLPEGIDENS